LENILSSNYGASQTYHYVCTLALQAMYDANGKEIANNPGGDYGEIYQILKKSLAACGYTNFASKQGFDRVYKESQDKCFTLHTGNGYTYNRRIPYPPNILVQFAFKLKQFAKVCQKQSNWRATLISSLNQKLQQTRSENFVDSMYSSSCIWTQAEIMKNSFAKLILEPTVAKHIEYCKCKKLMGQTTSKYNPVTHKLTVEYPFRYYEADFNKQCKKVCSQSSILEFE
jgi:hypothetical protein